MGSQPDLPQQVSWDSTAYASSKLRSLMVFLSQYFLRQSQGLAEGNYSEV